MEELRALWDLLWNNKPLPWEQWKSIKDLISSGIADGSEILAAVAEIDPIVAAAILAVGAYLGFIWDWIWDYVPHKIPGEDELVARVYWKLKLGVTSFAGWLVALRARGIELNSLSGPPQFDAIGNMRPPKEYDGVDDFGASIFAELTPGQKARNNPAGIPLIPLKSGNVPGVSIPLSPALSTTPIPIVRVGIVDFPRSQVIAAQKGARLVGGDTAYNWPKDIPTMNPTYGRVGF